MRFSHLVKDVPDAKHRDKLFFSTRWAMVRKAGDSAATTAHALSALSETVPDLLAPAVRFLRKKGYGCEDARDLTQLSVCSRHCELNGNADLRNCSSFEFPRADRTED
jgi:hypothetical protein